MSEPIPGLRSPADTVGGLIYFGRMIDKIRLHAAGQLPDSHHAGGGFDDRCVHFLRVSYQDLVDRVRTVNSTDEELLDWALNEGRHPDDEDIEIWNEFMRKRGWKDEVSDRLAERKAGDGISDRADIETMFQYIDADEGRF